MYETLRSFYENGKNQNYAAAHGGNFMHGASHVMR
jgi:hypothetical protein